MTRKTSLSALYMLCTACLPGLKADAADPLRFPAYSQTVTASFASPADAAAAEMTLSALPDGAARAFGTRWDDTFPGHMAKAAMLERAGVKGSFYIGGKTPEIKRSVSFRLNGIRELIARGHAVGNHTMSHPHMYDLSMEAVFEEILQSRINLERDTDHPVTSYAAPFGWGWGGWIDRSLQAATAGMLPECGMWVSGDNPIPAFGIPENVWYPAHRFSANDRQPDHDLFMKGLAKQMNAADRSPFSPRITLGTHSWCDEAGNALQEKWLKESCIRPDWVQLNDYEYGAYRYSVLNGAVEKTAVKGNTAVFRVRRFCPAALGDDIALSVSFSKKPVSAADGKTPLTRGANNTWVLPHAAAKRTLGRIGLAEADGRCSEIPELEMTVRPDFAARKVSVALVNRSDVKITDLYGVVHLPPQFKDRRRTFRLAALNAGAATQRVFTCEDAEQAVLPASKALYAASVDFSQAGRRDRLWATAKAGTAPGFPLPREAVRFSPVLPAATFTPEELKNLSAGTGALAPLGDGYAWQTNAVREKAAWHLVSPMTGKLTADETAIAEKGAVRLFALQFAAAKDENVFLISNAKTCDRDMKVYLNGADVAFNGNKTTLPVRPGTNRIILKTAVKPSRYVAPIHLAPCKDGRLATPCAAVPFTP